MTDPHALHAYFSTADFMPHGHCYLWKPPLVALHVGSDALIGTAYVVISLTLAELVRRIRLPFTPMILAFGVFIGACGLTHYMEILTLWTPEYWASGGVKAITAAASVATGAYLVRLRPTIVRVTESAQLSEERRLQLEEKNRELEALYARVKELDEAKTRFFANASHELRTPLALVLGPLEKLDAAELPPGARADLEVARRNARLLLRHVNELLDVARLEEGRMPFRPEEADLAALVREVARHFEVLARERRIRVALELPAALPARVDPTKLEHVLANLLGNAFKFAPEGGRVAVRLAAQGGRARLAVEDDGPGIAPDHREAVFERFTQEPGRPGRFGGAGLGLAIARDYVTLHGGGIRVVDGTLGGACLEVELPLAGPPGARGAPAAEPPAAQPERGAAAAVLAEALRTQAAGIAAGEVLGPADAPAVLVVEDNVDARRHVAEALAVEFRVETAGDGREGLRKAEALRPDAVVTDLMMPELAGDALVEELARRPELAETPVVVLTARAETGERVRLLRSGARDYVLKPFHAEELRARVRNLVTLTRARSLLARELQARHGDLESLAGELARRKRELELSLETARVAREQAERASRVKSTFLGLVSHELRTPLTSLQLGIATLRSRRDGPLAPRQVTTTERLDRATRRLLGLVESLLEYTRVESGRVLVRPEPVDLAALAAEVVEDVLPQAQLKLLTLALDPPPKLPPLRTDPRLLRLVLMNLVVNGVKYTAEGSVRVRLGHGPGGHVIEVRDTGPGIRPEDRERLFRPFEQLAPPGTASGVGLGLAIVDGVIAALGGRLELLDHEREGATFRIELPPEPPAAAEEGERYSSR